MDFYRKSSRCPSLLPELPDLTLNPDPSPLPDAVAVFHDELATLSLPIAKIPNQNYQDAFVLRHLRGLSVPEIASILNLNENTAKVCVFRGKKAVIATAKRLGLKGARA